MKLKFNMGLLLTEAMYVISAKDSRQALNPYYISFIAMSKLWQDHPDYYTFYLDWSYRRLA